MAFGPRQDKARAARPVCFVPAIGYEGGVNAPSLHIEDAAPDRRGRSLLDADPGPSVLVVLLLAILAVRIIALAVSHAELFFDEAQYWAWGQEPAFGYYTKPPLIAWIIGATTSLCGDAPFCVRLPSPLMHFADVTGHLRDRHEAAFAPQPASGRRCSTRSCRARRFRRP